MVSNLSCNKEKPKINPKMVFKISIFKIFNLMFFFTCSKEVKV